jgi:hypothetical protein
MMYDNFRSPNFSQIIESAKQNPPNASNTTIFRFSTSRPSRPTVMRRLSRSDSCEERNRSGPLAS